MWYDDEIIVGDKVVCKTEKYIPNSVKDKDDFEFDDYFDEHYEYPQITVQMLKMGDLYWYISTTFLNGWINYVKIISAFMITRYKKYVDNVKEADEFNKEKEFHHTDIGKELEDDVLILAKDEYNENTYWFFWSDRDCSDSAIGRFQTKDSEKDVKKFFGDYCNKLSRELSVDYGADKAYDALKLDVKKFKGWIKL